MGIIHRDIKPENIMINDQNLVRIIDFGVSKIIDQQKQGKEFFKKAGTPYYMAPEVINGGNYCIQADVWSIGVILYTMVSGFLPF